MSRISCVVTVALTLVIALGVFVTARSDQPGRGGAVRVVADGGRALREWDDRLTAMEREHELRLRVVQDDSTVPGHRHERYDQYFQNVSVFGGEAIRETDGKLTLSVTTNLYTVTALDTTPKLSEAEAVSIFTRQTGIPTSGRLRPALTILPRDDGSFVLTYRLTAFHNQKRPVLFINAQTGVVELEYNDLQTQTATGVTGNGVLGDLKKLSVTQQGTTFQAWDQMRPVAIRSYDIKGDVARADLIAEGITPLVTGDIAVNTASTWTDSVVVDGHTYVGYTIDYYYKRHGYQYSRPIYTMVHPARRADIAKYTSDQTGTYLLNAFFCGSCGANFEDLMVLGEGLPSNYYTVPEGQSVDYFAAALDIVAHEISHGVTGLTSRLIYRNESGALNEAFSDIMGTGTEFYFQSPGNGVLQADYLEGEDAFKPSPYKPGSRAGLRSLADPSIFGDPDHFTKRYTGTSDNGGVHTNSTIASHAFYLAIEGGTNKTSGLAVQGVGAANREQIEKIFFKGFTTLPSNATFSLARAKTISTATSLYGAGSAAERAVTQAWSAVGVF